MGFVVMSCRIVTTQLKLDALRGWIDIAEWKLLYGFPEKKTEGENLKT